MMSVLIAEDELLIRMGLESSIPWNDLGFEIVASVSDGEMAWQAWQQYRPNVLITDILMPRLDGIELIKRIRAQDQTCRIIVITCVEYFDILYSSLNFNITGYLLKSSMTRDSLYRMLNKLKGELNEAFPQQSAEEAVSVNDLLYFYLVDRSVSFEELRAAAPDSLPLEGPFEFITLLSPPLNTMTQQSLVNIVKEYFSPFGELYVLSSSERNHILLRAEKLPRYESCLEIFENIRSYMQDIFSVSFRAAFISADSLRELPELAQTADERLNNPFFYPDRFFSISPDTCDTASIPLLDAIENDPACRVFFEGDIARKWHELAAAVRDAWGKDKVGFIRGLSALRDFMLSLMPVTAPPALPSYDPTTFQSAPEALTALRDAAPHYTFNPLYSKGILQTIRFIQENYASDISLAAMARQLNISPNYYAVLFHQITGFRFSDFLINLRLYHASRLLRESDHNIAGIAESCGFFDAAYFSRYFKQVFGKTPRDYRKKR